MKGLFVLNSGYVKLIVAMLIWGSGGILTRFADQPAPVIMFFRATAAVVTVGAFMALTRYPLRLKETLRWGVVTGVCLAISGFCYYKAVQSTSIGTAVLACNTGPIFYITWACIFLKEKLEKRTFFALPLAAAGVGLLVSGFEFSLTSRDFVGILYGLSSGLAYSFVVLVAKGIPRIPAVGLIFVQMLVGMIAFAPAVSGGIPVLTPVSLGAMVVMGAIHSCFCLAIYYSALKQVKVQHAGILGYIDPASAIIYAYLCFGEIPSLTTLLGGLCILAAGALTVSGSAQAEDGDENIRESNTEIG